MTQQEVSRNDSPDSQAARRGWATLEEKGKQGWGNEQAKKLWDNFYAKHDPAIDEMVVLDLGCSWGYLLKYLIEERKPQKLIGTDIQPWWAIRDHGWDYQQYGETIELHAGNLPEINAIPAKSVDTILCTSVLQYMTPEQVEENVCRAYDLLRPGGEMLVRTRTFCSYLGADLHREIDMPFPHLFYGERDLATFMATRRDKQDVPYLNFLTASSYITIFLRSGFEIITHNRRPNRKDLPNLDQVRERFPWISEAELNCAELEVRMVRPIEPEDLVEFGKIRQTARPRSQ